MAAAMQDDSDVELLSDDEMGDRQQQELSGQGQSSTPWIEK